MSKRVQCWNPKCNKLLAIASSTYLQITPSSEYQETQLTHLEVLCNRCKKTTILNIK